jgi:phage/plasmid-like protein (TIGR03299 family)
MPWHKMGTVVADYPGSWDEARKLAGLAWEPIVEDQYRLTDKRDANGIPVIDTKTGQPVREFVQVPGYKYVVRSDTGAVLSSANASYEIIGHEEMGKVVEAILEAPDTDVKYETAGALNDGKRVWALAQLGQEIELKGDDSPLKRYLAVQNCHDGKGAMKAMGTMVRIVCANTWKAAEVQADTDGHCYSFRHTKNWRDMVEDARIAVREGNRQLDQYVENAKELLSLSYDHARTERFVKEFAIRRTISNNRGVTRINLPELVMSKPSIAKSMMETETGLSMILASRTCTGITPSAYQMTQAVGEFLDHFRRFKTNDTYVARTMLEVESDKLMGVKLARELATATL